MIQEVLVLDAFNNKDISIPLEVPAPQPWGLFFLSMFENNSYPTLRYSEPRCQMTGLCFAHVNERFEATEENRMAMIKRILDCNPHYKFKWETPLDYLWAVPTCSDITWWEAEYITIMSLEESMAIWPFSPAEYYNPYWMLSKDEFLHLSKEIEDKFEI